MPCNCCVPTGQQLCYPVAPAQEEIGTFDAATVTANPNAYVIGGLAASHDGGYAGAAFCRIFGLGAAGDAVGVVIEYTFTVPFGITTEVALHNNGGGNTSDFDGIGTATVELLDASDTLLFTGTIVGGNGTPAFTLAVPGVPGVAKLRLSDITNLPGGGAPDILWREIELHGASEAEIGRAAAIWCPTDGGEINWVDVRTGAEVDPANLVDCTTGAEFPDPPAQVAVPDVVGDTQAAGEAEITNAGLTPSNTDACSDIVAAGNIVSQDPAAGTMVNAGSTVNIVTSTGPCPAQVEVIDELNFAVAPTPSVQAAFEAARDYWNSVLTQLLTPINWNGDPNYQQILINVDVSPIDGPGMVLGSAGPTDLRPGSLLPVEGDMTFDSADLEALDTAGLLEDVVLHEMGHVLGIGTLWPIHGFEVDPNTSNWGFTGPLALAEYNGLAGRPAGVLDRVPVEHNTGNAGSDGGHFNEGAGHDSGEQCMDNELMSASVSGSMGKSRVTIASLEDLGYPGVNYGPADPWTCGNA